ncbi:mechanosensitive ion channel [Roseibium denhamense]|uniref:Small-conductance mechanosensitive channel n=1 Tax=Roseibium denhamense TaxID=76305 RepID=A0ABY1P6D5_9HYPH|nr:mechanosensitive ion channel domain-containing protein [Roseibium denhamense]MTI05166.1 mechanosensitive ion channel [Roseibium denhamense]SMP25889.1 small conductance mechanosensitive channel [Roseibium denhamense]
MEAAAEQVSMYTPLLINAIKAVIVLVIGWLVAGFVSSMVKRRIVSHPRIDDTIGGFASSMVRWLILLVTLIAVLQLFGIQATSLVAVLGAGTLAIGLALQGTLSDIAAGVMLVIFRPYKIGQFVEIGGTSGTVKDLNIFVTELVTPDNVQIIMPNGQAWGAVITNYSAHEKRRLDLTFGIDYGDDADKAIQIILDVAAADERIEKDPEPWVRVTNLGDSSVDLGVRVWCRAEDYWELKFHMLKTVKQSFDAGGISIPYPHSVEIQKAG